jgi:hypothetical protein
MEANGCFRLVRAIIRVFSCGIATDILEHNAAVTAKRKAGFEVDQISGRPDAHESAPWEIAGM